jgi:hypothetical protein
MDERVGQVRKMMSNDEIANDSRFLEGHCRDEYGNMEQGRDDNEDDNATRQTSFVKMMPSTLSREARLTDTYSETPKTKFVRVLWDLENIRESKREGGMNAVSKIRDFLKDKGFAGGSDIRVTAFSNPENCPVSHKTIEELDKGGVELVWVAAKRGGADRKLGLRISQEMHMLRDHANTTFVIISSDQNFRHHMQVLMNAGYTVIIIHKAPPGNWTKSLEMCATAAYHWDRDVLEKDSLNTNQTSDEDIEISTASFHHRKLDKNHQLR